MSPLRHTIRLLLKSPGFLVTAVLILGFGIGVNTAVFSLIESAILNAAPFPHPDRLVRVSQPATTDNQVDVTKSYFSYPDYVDLSRDQHSFESLSASYWDFLDLSGRGDAQRLTTIFTTPGLFKVTGLPFVLGRPFTEDEDKSGGPLVVVLSESVWRSRFNADPNIIGRNVTLSGESFQVIGVCSRQAEDVSTPWKDQIYVPLHVSEVFGVDFKNRGLRGLMCLGTLKEGVTREQAQADLAVIQGNLDVRYPDTDKGYTIRIFSLTDAMVSTYSTIVWSLGAAVGCLLLVSCANVRIAIGAQVSDVIQIVFWQGVKIVSVGLLIGLAAALLLGQFLSSFLYGIASIDPLTIVLVAIVLAFAACLACLIPTVRAIQINPVTALRQ